ncbi:MAG: rRNA maturation RNase YbeY [FCB group bacterium]|nr:rRNA maturation RNase YbeY [FCB group bacterium]
MIAVRVEIHPALRGPDPKASKALLNHVLKAEGVHDADITIIFGDDELLRDLKKTFFKKDQFTDVIAFRLNDYKEPAVEGELYISLPRAEENARELGEPFPKEVGRLIIHGGLHLLDYHDHTTEEKRQMQEIEDRYLDQFPWKTLFKT